ncbi:tRNA (5-methylaminomethyl-2-thiouridine)(34)-methyltransferase MnmD [Asticcacaulis sp. YBE204]|uniref:tRNA (5-methylaminomethyl-2-thiouridine)(34)-methyltransferase MnmD n=1 Tax=Asticcacaulis sp. YBE204 TaxID=1282363 RepID=UPI0003C3C5B7|nr:tRNA (5-methylaminomethyl-2-thiouridine)(34)-methyltransferase MnmD [Asticcacaulis sp. YBE204]ESQ80530.1 hypothetical protein AEYBE204_04485 [Asticcacaulis sp. YBE204]
MTSPETDPQLYFSDDGNPRSARFDDIYYSLQDGLSESRAVFLSGCQMPDIWVGRRHFTVGELGFGTGLNIAALIQLWAAHRPENGHLHLFSVEGFLMPRAAAAAALSAWPEIAPFAEVIIAQWPPQRRGFHIMRFPQWGVTLTLALMDVRNALSQWQGKADAWFLDGFSPACNPDMWADDVLLAVADKTAPGARLATFTVAGFVRRGLQAAGFAVSKQPGFGRKRERLEAVFPGESEPRDEPQRIAVVGGGIAGASVIAALRDYGYSADLVDPARGSGASGNPAGLVTPRLDAGGGAISDLFADAFYYATDRLWQDMPEAILSEGVLQRPATDRDAARFTKIAEQAAFDPQDMRVEDTGLRMPRALAIDPRAVVQTFLADVTVKEAVVDDYDLVFMTCGEGVFDLEVARSLDLRPVRGQIEVANAQPRDPQAQAWGGYYVPTPEGFVFGATHVRGDRGTDVREADRTHNLDTLRAVLPDEAALAAAETSSRASIRVTTRDHLPVLGPLMESMTGSLSADSYVLTGLGARGFCLAPLLGRALVAQALSLPSPLSAASARLVRVDRFQVG